MWGQLFEKIVQLHPTAQMTLILGALYLIKIGKIHIPRILNNEEDEPIHESCPNYNDFLYKIGQERSKGERIALVKYYDTVYEQMTTVRAVATEITDVFTDTFGTLLEKVKADELSKRDALSIYSFIIDGAVDDACGYLRRWVKKNHIIEMTDLEFQTYTHKRIEEVQKVIKKYIDMRYLKSQLIIDRKDVYEANMVAFYEKMQVKLIDMFQQIRLIAEKSALKIKEIEEE